MKVTIVLYFVYNGKTRKVRVTKQTDTYVQGYNLHEGASTKGATYSIAKMQDVKSSVDYVE